MKIQLVSVLLCVAPLCAVAATPGRDFLEPQIAPGAHFSDVYSISSVIQAEGFEARVQRNSGSADYTLRQVAAAAGATMEKTSARSAERAGASADASPELHFDATALYDGVAPEHGENIIREQGASQCWKGECRAYTDASGLLYNRLLWGAVPATLVPGQTWQVTIAQPWELGPAGSQTVRVLTLDAHTGTVTLEREGSATGAFAAEAGQVTLNRAEHKLVFDVTPGRAHWHGLATFRRGIVISDELLVTRTDTISSAETGPLQAQRRRYMLLNAAPYPTLE